MAVHVVNIPHIAEEEDLREFLEDVVGKGTVLSCRIILHQDTARSKGFGFVDFKEKQVATLAVQLSREDKLKFHNRLLTLSLQDRETFPRAPPDLFRIDYGKLHMGCLTAADTLSSMWSHGGSLILDLSSENQTLAIRLKRPNKVWMMEYKMEFHLSEISQLIAVQANSKNRGFLLKIKESPPYLFCRRVVDPLVTTGDPYVDMIDGFLGGNLRQNNGDEQSAWVRTTDFTPNVIGQSFAYLVEFFGSEAAELDAFLNRTGIYSDVPSKLRIKEEKPYAAEQVAVPLFNPGTYKISFEHVYKINNLVQHGKLSGPTLQDRFFKLIKDSSPSSVTFALQAMSGLESTCYDPVKRLRELLDEHKKGPQPPAAAKKEKGTTQSIHRLLVTPTKVYCLGPEPETSNRVIRQYEHLSSHFLRVNFVDENFGPLSSTTLMSEVQTSHSDVFKRIRFILNEGIFIGARKFEFLAFSASQLREGQLWMYATQVKESVTAEMIRAGMGDFATIRNVARCAARMGQCFSSSTETRKVLPLQVKRIKDITVKAGPFSYCFSDGIGKISEAFARTIAADCGLPSGLVPSAFQIRYGGYKGVVARDPTASSSFKLYLRPSMRKFDSPHMSLEVLEWTKPLPCHLNRQVITLLSTLGVNDAAFLNLQNQVVSKYERMLENDAFAMEILQESGSDSIALKMLECGYASKAEPLLRRLLCVFKDAQLNELKLKARIPVANGRLLMGCLDETGTLQYGEVFVKFTETSKSEELRKESVVTQKVFVAKNPCLHPGDIRTLQAVDVPQLGHMVDCVVFPQCGPRPHPSECSGSDLDGDLYVVSWDESLVPPTMEPPMDYTAPPTTVLDHPVEIEEIQEFFVNYMVNDNLGVIANAHVVHADKEPDMARSPKCLELAQLASMAVDFPKTGVPAVIPMELRPREYPDFMEKTHKTTYISQRILGKLYRSINPIAVGSSSTAPLTGEEMKICYDKDLIVPDFVNFLESAFACKKMYDMKLIGLMNQFGIREEAEIVSGHVLTMSQFYVRRQIDALPKVRLAFKVLQEEARSWFKGHGRRLDQKEEFAKASAWYHVTYNFTSFDRNDHTQYSKVTKSRIHLLSFPWVVSNVLFTLKQKALSRDHGSEIHKEGEKNCDSGSDVQIIGEKKRMSSDSGSDVQIIRETKRSCKSGSSDVQITKEKRRRLASSPQ